jgi:hypothetical protein
MSVRITAAGAVALVFLTCLTAPVSACDERYIKKCEKASAAAAAAAAAAEPAAPAAGRKAGRVHMVASRHVRHIRFVKRVRAPAFATRGRTLTSAESRMTTLQPESALARRFRGFIDPTPMAQNAFEAMRKPHAAALNLEPPVLLPAEATPVVAQAPVAPQPPTPVAAAPKQDRVAPQPAMELASAESKPVKLPDPAPASPKPARVAAADAAPAAQAFLTAASPQQPDQPQPTGFPVHQLVIALCGALGVAGALRFVVGA